MTTGTPHDSALPLPVPVPSSTAMVEVLAMLLPSMGGAAAAMTLTAVLGRLLEGRRGTKPASLLPRLGDSAELLTVSPAGDRSK